jgi:hypothetical protein
MKKKTPVDRLGPSVVDDVRALRQAIDNQVSHDIDKLAERARLAGEQFQAAIDAGKIRKPSAAQLRRSHATRKPGGAPRPTKRAR